MDDQNDWTAARVRLALLQKLESIQRSGVAQLPSLPSPAPVTAATDAVSAPIPKAPSSTNSAPQHETVDVSSSADAVRPAAATPTRELPQDPAAALAILQREVVRCQRCEELAKRRTQTVFGIGHPEAKLCFLGEAPGADEDRQGEPFVGAAGQLLNKIIQACTLRREEVFILNVLKCRPPGNRNPSPEEAANCRGFLDRQLEIIQPDYICCLGAVAAQSLLGTTQAVGRLRGKFHDYQGIQVIVTYHPSYLLRQPEMKRAAWEDMKLLMQAMGLEIPKR